MTKAAGKERVDIILKMAGTTHRFDSTRAVYELLKRDLTEGTQAWITIEIKDAIHTVRRDCVQVLEMRSLAVVVPKSEKPGITARELAEALMMPYWKFSRRVQKAKRVANLEIFPDRRIALTDANMTALDLLPSERAQLLDAIVQAEPNDTDVVR